MAIEKEKLAASARKTRYENYKKTVAEYKSRIKFLNKERAEMIEELKDMDAELRRLGEDGPVHPGGTFEGCDLINEIYATINLANEQF